MMVTALAPHPVQRPAPFRHAAAAKAATPLRKSEPAGRSDWRRFQIDLQHETGALRSELLEAEGRLQAELQLEAQAVRHDLGTASRHLERVVDRMVWKLTGLMTAEAVAVYALTRLLF